MFHIIYVSEASYPLTRQELVALHARARDKNRVVGITGMLIHKDGRFAQVLEGDETAVRQLFEAIRKDGRHGDVRILLEGPIALREFADWSMGFRDLQDADLLGLYGHAKPLGKSLNIENFKKNPTDCLHLFRFIRDLQLTRN
jgi:hypothetical protein